MKIVIEFIDHIEQRYETVGDYQQDENGDIQIKVSKFGTELERTLVAIHELVEFALLRDRGVTDQDVDKFDFDFEGRIARGEVGQNDEPGFDIRCPYGREHTIATAIDLQLCALAGINWNEYSKKIENLFKDGK